MPNTNCLEGNACPECGNEYKFRIAARTIAIVTDDGVEDYGDMEWDEASFTQCSKCFWQGRLKEFWAE